jgi:hypothetical protein
LQLDPIRLELLPEVFQVPPFKGAIEVDTDATLPGRPRDLGLASDQVQDEGCVCVRYEDASGPLGRAVQGHKPIQVQGREGSQDEGGDRLDQLDNLFF